MAYYLKQAGKNLWHGKFSIFPEDLAVHAISTRLGGVSRPPYDALDLALHVGDEVAAVRENRGNFGRSLGLDARRIVTPEQDGGVRHAAARRTRRHRPLHRSVLLRGRCGGRGKVLRGVPLRGGTAAARDRRPCAPRSLGGESAAAAAQRRAGGKHRGCGRVHMLPPCLVLFLSSGSGKNGADRRPHLIALMRNRRMMAWFRRGAVFGRNHS